MTPRQTVSLVQASVCFVASLALCSIWILDSPGTVQASDKRKKLSILFLAIACILWSVMGVLQYRMDPSRPDQLADIFRTIFSTINTAFIVGATAGLDVYDRFMGKFRTFLQKRTPALFVEYPVWLVMAAFFVVGFGSSATVMLSGSKYANLPDMVLSAATLSFVMVGLYKSFEQRHFRLLAWLSIVVVGAYVVVQFAELHSLKDLLERYDSWYWVANVSFKLMLVYLFTSLIVSWIYDTAAEEGSSTERFLQILAPYQNGKKTIFEIEYGYGLEGKKKVMLTEKSYLRVLEMALRWKKTNEPVKTSSLHHKSEDEVRQDLSQILAETKIDPLFDRPGKGLRQLRLPGKQIKIDPKIQEWANWENGEFAKSILDNKKPNLDFPWEGGTKRKENDDSKANKAGG